MPMVSSQNVSPPEVRRIKSKHDFGDVLVDFTDEKCPELPGEIKQILMDMTFGGTDQLHLWEVEKCAEILERVKVACTPNGSKSSYAECEGGVDLLMSLMKAKEENRSEMVYTHLPEQLQSVFKCWDLDGNGSVSATELHAAAAAWTKVHEEKAFLKRMLFGSVLVMLVLFTGIFVLGMVTAELSKEFRASPSGTMVDASGQAVRVANAGFDVSNDGSLVKTNTTAESTIISTASARKDRSLHSAMADGYFDALDEITIHSEKGHKLNLKIHGFARVPLLGARCGNVVLLFPSVDGHLTLDSTDLSLNGHLESLFKNAGFELAVGGGRRLQSLKSVRGFFNHVEGLTAGWKCEGVPLPKVPSTYSWHAVRYVPCSKINGCASKYGGHELDSMTIPAEHLDAVSTRLDDVRRRLDEPAKALATQLRFKTSTVTAMKSPSYSAEFRRQLNHPTQEGVSVMNTVSNKGVSFQRMLTGKSARTYCENQDVRNDPRSQLSAEQKAGMNASLHMEFLGVAGEADGRMYRHWRMMPADGLRKWLAGEGGKPSKDYFEYWDDAESLTARRLLDSNGMLSVFDGWKEDVTDADVEDVLQWSDEVEPQALSCVEGEDDNIDAAYGGRSVPTMSRGDITQAEIEFYVKELTSEANAEELASELNKEASGAIEAGGEAEVRAEEADDEADNGTSREDVEAWATIKSLSDSSASATALGAFASYALRSRELFAMPDACVEVCAGALVDAKSAVATGGEGVLCDSQKVQVLAECLDGLTQPLLDGCQQSPFMQRMMISCASGSATERKLYELATDFDALADGTQAIEVDASHRERLGLEADDVRLLTNGSAEDTDLVIENVRGERRLFNFKQAVSFAKNGKAAPSWVPAWWCGSFAMPLCIKFTWPLKGCETPDMGDMLQESAFAKTGRTGRRGGVADLKGTSSRRGGVAQNWMGNKFNSKKAATKAAGSKRKTKPCKLYLKIMGDITADVDIVKVVKGEIPGVYFTLSIVLGGQINILNKVFPAITNPPVYGMAFAEGGISISNRKACPKQGLKFTIQGYIKIGFKLGLDIWPGVLPTINLLQLTLSGGAKKKLVKEYTSRKENSRRRTPCAGCRRRGWGDWSRRRGPEWQYTTHPEICTLVVWIKVELKILCVKGWLLYEYFVANGGGQFTCGVDYYQIWLLLWGSWVNACTMVIASHR